MREFVYFSRNAVTTGNFDDLMSAGRMDIVAHIVVAAFFMSNAQRSNVKLTLFFYGPPNAPRCLEIISGENGLDVSMSKKDIIGLIKRMLYKAKDGKRIEAFTGCFISSVSVLDYLKQLQKDNRSIYLLDSKGDMPSKGIILDNPVFFMGDHEGIPKDEKRRIKKAGSVVSVGPHTYFASQTLVSLQISLDNMGLY